MRAAPVQTSLAVRVALGSFPTEHYWMYAFASTAVGVLVSLLLANQCTLGKGAPTLSDCRRGMQLLCFEDCCGGGGGGSAGGGPLTHRQQQQQQEAAASAALAAAGDDVEALRTEVAALTQRLQEKERECAGLAARLQEPGSAAASIGGAE